MSKQTKTSGGWIIMLTLLVPIGAGMAWGLGGFLFGIGLWCLVGAVGNDIEAAIKDR